jgi:peptidoglycan/LPS O-acetylase OafA/YrhL
MEFQKPIPGKQQFPALTGIRAIAALIVFFYHLHLNLGLKAIGALQDSFYSGVTFFFVLSGFLITYRYYGRGPWPTGYFTNRFARIYPLYFLVLTAVLLLLKNWDPVFLLQNYTLTHNLIFAFPSHGMAINPSWSLTVEECFYLLAPMIFFLSRKYGLWLPFLLNLAILILLLARIGPHWSIRDSLLPLGFGSFFGRFVEFYAGIWLALIILQQERSGVYEGKGKGRTLAGIAGIAAVSVLLAYVSNKNASSMRLLMIVGNNLLLPIPVVLLYYGLMREQTFLRRSLSSPIMGMLGRSSYAFYLLHQPLLDYLGNPYLRPWFGNSWHDAYVITMILITVVVSITLYRFYEKPMNSLIRGAARHFFNQAAQIPW